MGNVLKNISVLTAEIHINLFNIVKWQGIYFYFFIYLFFFSA